MERTSRLTATRQKIICLVLLGLSLLALPILPSDRWKPGPAEDVLPGLILRPTVLPGVRRWQLETATPRARNYRTVVGNPDGHYLAVGTGRGIRIWDTRTGENLVDQSRPTAFVWAVAFSPDGRTLASGGRDGLIGRRSCG